MKKPTDVVARRVAAFLIDLVLWVVVIMAAWFVLTIQMPVGCVDGGVEINGHCRAFAQRADRTFWFVFIALVSIGVFVVMQGRKGTTPGKAMLRIKVVKQGGDAPGIWRTLVRELLWVVDFWLVGWTTAMLSQHNQRVGDMVAGTYVVTRDFAPPTGTSAQ